MRLSRLANRCALTAAACTLTLTTFATASAQSLTGAGATFPYPAYAKWAEAYKAKTGVAVNYQSIGSSGGIRQIRARTVDFGASDRPLTPAELDEAGLVQFPAIIGGVVPVTNQEGIAPGELKLTGEVLADIYLGRIKSWNDPRIVALNPGAKLTERPITVVRRADGSGTSFLFTDYLSKVSGDWKSGVGASTAVKWPTGIGGKGNEGVAAYVQRIKGAIGYVEFAYAKRNQLDYIQLVNRDGKTVRPTERAFAAAAANAEWSRAPGFHLILTDQPGAESWPITGASFILMQRQPENAANAREVLKFFDWALREGASLASALDYVAMPAATLGPIQEMWRAGIRSAGGEPVWK